MEICDLLKIGPNQLLAELYTVKKYAVAHKTNDLILHLRTFSHKYQKKKKNCHHFSSLFSKIFMIFLTAQCSAGRSHASKRRPFG